MELLPGWKGSELTAVIFGVVSMISAWLSLKRAERSERQSERAEERAARAEERAVLSDEHARELAFAQRKSEAHALALQGEAALMKAKRKLLSVRDKALLAGVPDIAQQALTYSNDFDHSVSGVRLIRQELDATKSAGRTHDQLLDFVDSKITAIRALVDPSLIDEQVSVFVDPAETHIHILELKSELDKELHRRGLAARDG